MQLARKRAGAIALLVALTRIAAARAAGLTPQPVSGLHGTHGVVPHDDGSDSGDEGGGDDGDDGDDRSLG